jgi:hypothetical protein
MSGLDDFMLPCLNKTLFGVECPGCGMQRSLSLIIQGEFIAAYKIYPAIYALIVLFLFIGLNIFFKFKNSNKIITILAILSILIILINYVYKLTF